MGWDSNRGTLVMKIGNFLGNYWKIGQHFIPSSGHTVLGHEIWRKKMN